MDRMSRADLKDGYVLKQVVKEITLEMIERYAEVSGDRNSLHAHSDVADNSLLHGLAAHGMITVALVSQMMAETFEESWLTGGQVEVSFLSPVRPGDQLQITGKVAQKITEEDGFTFICDITCRTQTNEVVATAKTLVPVKR